MEFSRIKELDRAAVLPTYGRYDVAFARGENATLYDTEGKAYIDFASGIGVISVGHANPRWTEAVCRQAGTLAHVSNLFYTEPYARLAERLKALSGMEGVFFANSGAEANEGAIKLARKYSRDKYGPGRATVVTLLQSFHGRTLAALTATGQPSFHQHFFPFPEGFRYVPPNDAAALTEALTDDVCAVLVEGIQGEGGVRPLEDAYVAELAALARAKDILLIFDEVQTGNGRTGTMFSYQGFGILPDIATTAKGLGGGLPIGAILAGASCRDVLTAGTHGSTFGGNPVCCAAALAVLDILTEEGFLERVKEKGERIRRTVQSWGSPKIRSVRGKGLMLGLELDGVAPKAAVADLLARGLVALTAGEDVLRLLPPLTITDDELDRGLAILEAFAREA